MLLLRMFGILVFLTLLAGCPAKTKVLYLNFSIGKEIAVKDFLAKIGNNVDAPLADERVGLNFLPNQCEHRQYKSKSENTLLGTCALKTSIYVYALLPDHGDDPQKYLDDSAMSETLSKIDQYKKNIEFHLKEAKIPFQSNGFRVGGKLEFMHMLEDQAKQ